MSSQETKVINAATMKISWS